MLPQICRDVSELCEEAAAGCGVILLAEETLKAGSISLLVRTLTQQPTWSNIPLTIITSGGEVSALHLRRLAMFGGSGNVTLLERPFRRGTLVSRWKSVAGTGNAEIAEARDMVVTLENLMRQQKAQSRLFDTTCPPSTIWPTPSTWKEIGFMPTNDF